MTLVCRPKGRGNWKTLTMQIEDLRVPPLLFRVGTLLVLAGVTFRVCEVRA